MSKHQTINTIRRELHKLNEQIDLKIIQGQFYKEEARRHKLLLAQLRQIKRREWLRSFSFLTSIF
jgi:hypothetical protein